MPNKRTRRPSQKAWDELNQKIINCRRCPRLVGHCEEVAKTKRRAFRDWDYWGRPVPNLGDRQARILLVGLAPAAHGANRTGRMFTGDRSGDFLFEAMHSVGLCNQPHSEQIDDGLQLKHCTITAICHCAPPANKPTLEEQSACREWLLQTIRLGDYSVFVALGQLAWKAMLKVAVDHQWLDRTGQKFGHGAEVGLDNNTTLLGCFHPSQQNTFTGKLTQRMLRQVLRIAIRRAGGLGS